MMNKEITKAMNRKEKKRTCAKWWNKNGYKVMRVVLFPIWIGAVGLEKIEQKLDNRVEWNDKRVKQILDYYVPRYANWNAEDKTFYFFDNGYGWDLCRAKKLLNRKDRRFWNKYNGFVGGEIRQYLINKFELEGFEKTILNTYDGWTEIEFKIIEKEG